MVFWVIHVTQILNKYKYFILKYLQVSFTVFASYLADDTKWGLTCSQYLYLIQELCTLGVHRSSNKFIFSSSLTSDTEFVALRSDFQR